MVRGVIEVYRPVLSPCSTGPPPLVWFLGVTFLVGLAPLGSRPLFLATLVLGLIADGARRRRRRRAGIGVASLVADRPGRRPDRSRRSGREFMTPLDEGMVMDMPITVPRASVAESADDLKARDMILCRFPEVDMVVGKAGRAETPTDPAPMDMIETMVNFRPRDFWPGASSPRRRRAPGRPRCSTRWSRGGLVTPPPAGDRDRSSRGRRRGSTSSTRRSASIAYQRNREFGARARRDAHRPATPRLRDAQRRAGASTSASSTASCSPRRPRPSRGWRSRSSSPDAGRIRPDGRRTRPAKSTALRDQPRRGHLAGRSVAAITTAATPVAARRLEPLPALDAVQAELSHGVRSRPGALADGAGRAGRVRRRARPAVQMPGWTNVWTMPIQNRVDMLSTGVNTPVGVRVLGRNLDDVVAAVARRSPAC